MERIFQSFKNIKWKLFFENKKSQNITQNNAALLSAPPFSLFFSNYKKMVKF